jgi:hypothetical protein
MNLSNRFFELCMLLGLLGAIYLYGFAFDDFSETDLVRVSYLWVAAIIFGTHGLLAHEFKTIRASGRAETTPDVLDVRKKAENRSLFSKVATAMLWSFLLTTTEATRAQPIRSAALATVIWVAGLAFFFEAIFPAL